MPSAQPGATPERSIDGALKAAQDVRVQPASGNASSGVQTRRSASARGDLPDAPDADLDAEPEELMCPITRTMFRDPVCGRSGHTYERSAILSHFRAQRSQGPAHALRPEQHEGDDELGGETRLCRLGWTSTLA